MEVPVKKTLTDYAQLINDCMDSNRRAQQKLFKRFYGMLFKVCMRYAKCYEEAQDMLTESFMKIFQNLGKYENKGSFEMWLIKVTTNVAIDYQRKFFEKIETVDIDSVAENMTENNVENEAIAKMNSQSLMQLIQQLPDKSRMVFNLYVFENYSHADIATMLQIKEGTSHWHLNFAKNKLKEEILKLK